MTFALTTRRLDANRVTWLTVFSVLCVIVLSMWEKRGGILYQRIPNHMSSIRCRRSEMEVAANFNGEGHNLSNARFVR